MKFEKILHIAKRHAVMLIAVSIALLFVFFHLIVEAETFEFGPLSKKGFVHLLDLKSLDIKFTSRPSDNLPEPKVVIAAIDEKSVERFGLWPWSRAVIGDFVRATTQGGAKAIGFDAAFGDEDRNSSYIAIRNFLESYEQIGLHQQTSTGQTLFENFRRVEERHRLAVQALKNLEKRSRKMVRGAAKQSLVEARRAVEQSAQDLSQTLETLSKWEIQSNEFYNTIKSETALISPDDAFANALAESPQTILGYIAFYDVSEIVGTAQANIHSAFSSIGKSAIPNVFEEQETPVGTMLQPASTNIDDLEVREMVAILPPLKKLAARATSFGYFNASPDPDGPVRVIRFFHKHAGKLYPSLSLATVAKYYNQEIRPLKHQIFEDRRLGHILIGDGNDTAIPTDMHGRFLINYYAAPEEYFPTYSIADFIDNTVPKEAYQGKVVLFGMTAQGLFDLRPTPFSAVTPGVYIHASAIQNVLDGYYLERPYGIALMEAIFYLLLGIFFGLLLPRLPAWGGLVSMVGFSIALYVIDTQLIFTQGIWIKNVLPTLQVLLTFVGINVYGFLTEGKERRKIRKAFQFYLTKSVVDEVLKDPARLKLGGERRMCTVLFSDIRGFTTISERLSPEELVHLLNAYLTPMTNLVFKYDGTLDKYMGDAIMAIFGAPVAYPNHAARACFAALEMMEELERLRAEWAKEGWPDIDIGIGLNSGPMSVGNMGSDVRFDYTVMGDNVNLGSRLEGINKQYGTNIIISEFALEQAKNEVFAREMDAVRVKGKKEPVRIFELLGKGTASEDQQQFIQTFEQGLAHYKGQEWEKAIQLFEKVRTELRANDFASTMYIQRCETMRENPPGEGWDGVYTMTTK